MVALGSAVASVVALVAIEVLEGTRASDDCGQAVTSVMSMLQWAVLILSAAAALLGLLGLFARSTRSRLYAAAGIAVSLVAAKLVLTPMGEGLVADLGTYVCSVTTPGE